MSTDLRIFWNRLFGALNIDCMYSIRGIICSFFILTGLSSNKIEVDALDVLSVLSFASV